MVVEPASVALLPQLARQYDEPIADSSMLPTTLLTRLVRSQVTVALSGDCSDELFGGYRHYHILDILRRLRRYFPAPMRQWIGEWASSLPLGLIGRHHLLGLYGDAAVDIAHINLYFDHRLRQRLLAPALQDHLPAIEAPELFRAQLCRPELSVLQQALAVDFQTTMAEAFLVKVDRASMLTSLEVRAPFLDHRLVEFVFRHLPDSLRVQGGRRKILLQRIAKRLLPPTFDVARKQGFTMPLQAWFKGVWGDAMCAVLAESDPALFNRQVIEEIVHSQHRGFANTNRLFSLTIFELWRREYRISLP